jgi:hypothetical protein
MTLAEFVDVSGGLVPSISGNNNVGQSIHSVSDKLSPHNDDRFHLSMLVIYHPRLPIVASHECDTKHKNMSSCNISDLDVVSPCRIDDT